MIKVLFICHLTCRKNNSLEKSVHVILEMILVLIIVVRICASIVKL